MAFFAEIPEPEAEPDSTRGMRYVDHPWQTPPHWLPGGAPLAVTVARSAHTAVRLTVGGVYPRGLALELLALLDPEGPDVEALHHHRGSSGELRFGMLWPDGRRAETLSPWQHPMEDAGRDGFHLHPEGGHGGGLTWRSDLWLWPLPPPGPVTVYLRWDARDVPETATWLDLTSVVEAADQAEELWPLAAQPDDEGFGWISYAPVPSAVQQDRPDDTTSGDGSDAGDEDG